MDSLASRIDPIFAAYDKPDSPGCSLVIARDGEIIYERGYGCAHLEHGVPITPTTVFHVASISKQFASMAILLLQNDGKLSVGDDVHKYLPELPDYGHVITLDHMLHHTSGLRDQWDLLDIAGWREDDLKTNDDVLDLACRQLGLNFKPGDEWSYSNTGHTLLGIIVHRITGKTLREFCQERIFGPLGMTNTHFHDDHTMLVRNRASAYVPGKGGYAVSIPPFDTVGATSLFTTAEDMVRWDQNFRTGQVGGLDGIGWMTTPAVLNTGASTGYGGGLQIRRYRGLNVVEHGGSDAGYRAEFMRFPDQRLAIIILGNFAMMFPNVLAERVADALLGDEMEALPPALAPYTATADELAAVAGVYYSRQSEVTLRLDVKDGHIETPMAGPMPLVLVSPTRLQLVGMPVYADIEPAKAGHPARALLTMGPGFVITFEKVEAANPTAAQLAEYAGDFACRELPTKYTLGVRGDMLVLSRYRFPDLPLKPAMADRFSGPNRDLQFIRSASGRVTGFRLYTGRSRGIRFDRAN